MINRSPLLVGKELDGLDELAEVPVCVSYKINGKETDEIPAHASGYDRIECIYHKLPGWQTSTEGITQVDKLPRQAREYLKFVEQQTGARIGMISTGPGREQTMFVDEFSNTLNSLTQRKWVDRKTPGGQSKASAEI
jgi:adenylosuccinate synthase